MKFSEYPFLRYVLFFILGVWLYPYVNFLGIREIIGLTVGLFCAYLILSLVDSFQSAFHFKPLFPILAYALLISLGLLFSHLKDATNDPSHLVYHQNIEGYLGIVNDLDQKKPNTFANRILVTAIKKEGEYLPATGEVIIYHKLTGPLLPGEMVWVHGTPSTIPPPQNPKEFDYRKFLGIQQIYHSHFVDDKIRRIGRINHSPINNFVLGLRASVKEKMDRYILTPHSNQIAKALLLGQSKYLDKEVSEAYVTAGTMHVLAVSGLHVGIIYGFFFLFIKPYQLRAHKRVMYLSFVIIIIWIYALVTGMCPSVLRAATMFTLMGLAQMKSRSPSIYNALALSALILMVYDPFIFYSVGFQLSYLAVFGIVLLQSKIKSLWEPKNKILVYFWEITAIGIAAQLATFPLSVHYFHVFPTYFMFSNLIAIPGSFMIMTVGIPFMLLSFIHPIAHALGKVVDLLIQIENWVMFTFQELPSARVEHINFPPVEMALFWALVVSIYLLSVESKKKYAYLSLSLFLGLILSNWVALWKDHQRNELYIYQVGKELAVDHFYRGKLYSRMEEISPQDISYKVLPNRINKGHSQPLELKFVEEKWGTYLFLPGGYVLQLNGEGFEFEGPPVRNVSQYNQGEWLALEMLEDRNLESSYKIVMK